MSCSGDETCALLGNDARPEQVPHVRGHGVDPALVGVEADDVVAAAVLGPEVVVEARVQLLGLALEPLGERDVGAEAPGELGDAQLRVVDVRLDLGGRDRQVRDRSVGELDAVPRVLPALVAEALARPRLVLDVAVAVTIAVLVDPGERSGDLVPSPQNERVLAGEAPVLREEDQPERRRVGGAVVGAVRLLAQLRQLAAADLVQDLAGLLVAEVVDARALQGAEQVKRAACKPRADPERLQGRDQRVPAEERHEPREPGCREDVVLAEEVAGDAQRCEVDDRLPEDAGEQRALRLDARNALEPAAQRPLDRLLPSAETPLPARRRRCSPARRP